MHAAAARLSHSLSIKATVVSAIAGAASAAACCRRPSANAAATVVMAEASDPTQAANIYGFSAKDIDGNDVSLDKYRGHVCVIANVASK